MLQRFTRLRRAHKSAALVFFKEFNGAGGNTRSPVRHVRLGKRVGRRRHGSGLSIMEDLWNYVTNVRVWIIFHGLE